MTFTRFFSKNLFVIALGAIVIVLLLFVLAPRMRQTWHGWRFGNEIQAYAFGGHENELGVLQPLRFLFLDDPDAAYYELLRCSSGIACRWPDDFELVPLPVTTFAPNRLLLFETPEFSSETAYRIRGMNGDGTENVLSPIMRAKTVSQQTALKPSWISFEKLERGSGERLRRVPFFTWNVAADSPNRLVIIKKDGDVVFAFVPSGDEWEAGATRGIRYSLFGMGRIPSFEESGNYEAALFAADSDRWTKYIAKYAWN